ncbi:MAG: hypothetical protein J0H74_31840 [Chitinophagaceae bacterium]|nr:hypothetical protein [Chitinophagaceae bacterium]
MKNRVGALLVCCLGLTASAQIKDIPFGDNNHIRYDLDRGSYDIVFNRRTVVKDAYAICRSGDRIDSSISYRSRKWSSHRRNGKRVYAVTSSGDGRPEMVQEFLIDKRGKTFRTYVLIKAAGSNYMSPLTCSQADIHEQGDDRALLVPFDNDAWVRYNAAPLASADMTSSEVTALYNNDTRHGLIIGAMMQRDWKTGIRIKGSDSGRLSHLSVFGGYTDKTYTHDIKAHGTVTRQIPGYCMSPMIMIGWFDDWREGMEDYAKNANAGPHLSWTGATPFGWNSWGAMQDKLTLSKAKAVVDFFHDSCERFRTADSTLYIDLDSYWDLLRQGEDYSRLKEFCDYCETKGFRPGIYWAPFVDWGKSPRKMEGSDYNYQDCWITQNGNFIDLDGARALDPTHPGTISRIAYLIGKFKECGFKMIKIDFLGHAALEADHFYQSTVNTGIQAFHYGMEKLVSAINGQMLIYAAISPNIITAPYAHMRRIACDAYSNISETGYTLNSTTYGWWLGKLYNHIDADHIVFKAGPAGMNRARLTSALVTGTVITGDDYSVPGVWHATAQTLLQNKDLLDIAHAGRAFRPVEGNTGDKPENFFVRKEGKRTWLAIVNYDDKALEYTIRADRWGIKDHGTMKELFSKKVMEFPGMLTIVIPPADAVIYRMD